MIVTPNTWCDHAHINEGIKKAGIMPAQKNINKTIKG
ncbi:hypothetical protein BvCmsD61A_03156 [Escherichia coli]|nr:hypothetical protein BvCmsC100A_04718 [Escherichia coli]GCL10430.1 hypothetical protein BvCmsD61A_03156 [Escherichia coli]